MRQCQICKHKIVEDDARYCSACGAPLADSPTAAVTRASGTARKRKILLLTIPLNIALVAGAFFMMKGCSSVTGSFTAKGEPLGNFTFVPKQCRSGQRLGFFGAVMLGQGQQDGALVAFLDPAKGKQLKVEVPGSCEPPDYEKCKEVIIDPHYCSRYDIKLDKTSIMVNDIVLVEGSLDIECSFPGGGSAAGKITFDRCN